MYPQYRAMINAQAFRAVAKAPLMPADQLAVGDDEYHAGVPFTLFRDQRFPAAKPTTVPVTTLSYERTAVKGSGDTLDLDSFPTDSFDIGAPYGGE